MAKKKKVKTEKVESKLKVNPSEDSSLIRTILEDGTIEYTHKKHNKLHRCDGPAKIQKNKNYEYFINGLKITESNFFDLNFRKTNNIQPTELKRKKEYI